MKDLKVAGRRVLAAEMRGIVLWWGQLRLEFVWVSEGSRQPIRSRSWASLLRISNETSRFLLSSLGLFTRLLTVGVGWQQELSLLPITEASLTIKVNCSLTSMAGAAFRRPALVQLARAIPKHMLPLMSNQTWPNGQEVCCIMQPLRKGSQLTSLLLWRTGARSEKPGIEG